ncbi:hypothetical protein GOP47_0030014 [Adiantum capillus-veneris]|nr:hypothetical protein GOP47_0030014 [Adiantum capillus-veneris]
MEEAMLTPPSTGKKRSKIEISSQAQTLTEHPEVTNAMSQPPGQKPQEAHTSTKGMKPPMQTSQDADTSTKGSKRQRETAVIWDDKSTHTLLQLYEEQWSHIKKGNFRPKDWEDLVFAVNREITGSFNPEHTRNRIDTLKKVHKKELSKQSSTGSVPSTWIFFDMCDALWGKTPKCSGIAGALDSESHRSVSSTADTPIDLDGGSGQNPQPDFVDLDGVFGKKVKQPKKSSLGTVAKTMGDGMKQMCEAYKRAEDKKTSTLQELESARMLHEERLARIREEEETKRHQIFLEIAKLISKKPDHHVPLCLYVCVPARTQDGRVGSSLWDDDITE